MTFWERSQQQRQIFDIDTRTDRTASEVDGLTDEVRDLKRQLERLSLGCQAMWELLREHTTLTEEDLLNKITEVDLRDGKLDGAIGKQIQTCSNCGRNSNSNRQHCIYCGNLLPTKDHIFG